MTMPSPRRVARQSVAILVGYGMTKSEASRTVQILCDEATGIIWRRAPDLDVTWLADIAAEAAAIGAQAQPSAAAVASWADRVADWRHKFDAQHTHAGACPSLVPHAAHTWWPHPDRQTTCCGHGALDRPGA